MLRRDITPYIGYKLPFLANLFGSEVTYSAVDRGRWSTKFPVGTAYRPNARSLLTVTSHFPSHIDLEFRASLSQIPGVLPVLPISAPQSQTHFFSRPQGRESHSPHSRPSLFLPQARHQDYSARPRSPGQRDSPKISLQTLSVVPRRDLLRVCSTDRIRRYTSRRPLPWATARRVRRRVEQGCRLSGTVRDFQADMPRCRGGLEDAWRISIRADTLRSRRWRGRGRVRLSGYCPAGEVGALRRL